MIAIRREALISTYYNTPIRGSATKLDLKTRLKDAFEALRHDGSVAGLGQYVLLKRVTPNASIGSYIQTAFSMTWDAISQGMIPVIDLGISPEFYRDKQAELTLGDNIWEWYFSQTPRAKDLRGTDCIVRTWEHDGSHRVFPWATFDRLQLRFQRYLIPHFLRFNDEVWKQLDLLEKKHPVDFAKTIAVVYRGTDFHQIGITAAYENYFKVLDSLMNKYPGHKLYVQTDEQEFLEATTKRYGQRAFHIPYFKVGKQNGPMVDALADRSGYQKGMDAILIMLMLSKCHTLVKGEGNLGDLAAMMKSDEEVYHVWPDKTEYLPDTKPSYEEASAKSNG